MWDVGSTNSWVLVSFCGRLFSRVGAWLPPAFVVDIGLINGRGWAIMEFNAVWCSGILGADAKKCLPCWSRACQDESRVSAADRQWLLQRR